MKEFIFINKNIEGEAPVVLEAIDKELSNMILIINYPLEDLDTKLSQLMQEEKILYLEKRKNPKDEKLKEMIQETKMMIKALHRVVFVRQKVEELTNYIK